MPTVTGVEPILYLTGAHNRPSPLFTAADRSVNACIHFEHLLHLWMCFAGVCGDLQAWQHVLYAASWTQTAIMSSMLGVEDTRWQVACRVRVADSHRLQRQLLQRLVRHGCWYVAYRQPCGGHRKIWATELERLVCSSPLAPWPVARGHRLPGWRAFCDLTFAGLRNKLCHGTARGK